MLSEAKVIKYPPSGGTGFRWETRPVAWRAFRGPAEGRWNSHGEVPIHTLARKTFQDFRVDRLGGSNPNPVAWLWANAHVGSSIMARVVDSKAPHLSVTFENRPTGWPGSLAICPMKGVTAARGSTAITFQARTAADDESVDSSSTRVYLSARLMSLTDDGESRCWAFGQHDGHRLLKYQIVDPYHP